MSPPINHSYCLVRSPSAARRISGYSTLSYNRRISSLLNLFSATFSWVARRSSGGSPQLRNGLRLQRAQIARTRSAAASFGSSLFLAGLSFEHDEKPAADAPAPLLSGQQHDWPSRTGPFNTITWATKRMLGEPITPLFSSAVVQHCLNANIQPTTVMKDAILPKTRAYE
jgi:hypothetical protein